MHLNGGTHIVVEFKTSEQCRVELVAHTMSVDKEGFLQLADYLPVSAARASFQNEDKTGASLDKDIKLMKSLARDGHVGPFEHNHATFIIECPLFIRSQIMRHRTGAYNEWSRRYTSEKIAFWIPDKWRAQSKSNKQASTDGAVDVDPILRMEDDCGSLPTYEEVCRGAVRSYEAHLSLGVSREQARAMLPQSLLTQFYMTMNLRNWVHFLKLRLDSHAQREVQIVARKIESQLRELWPEAMGVLLPIEEPSNV